MWKRSETLWGRYRRWWKDFTYSMCMVHTIIIGLLTFLATLKAYQDGEIGWFFPAIGLATATLACFALFIPVDDPHVR